MVCFNGLVGVFCRVVGVPPTGEHVLLSGRAAGLPRALSEGHTRTMRWRIRSVVGANTVFHKLTQIRNGDYRQCCVSCMKTGSLRWRTPVIDHPLKPFEQLNNKFLLPKTDFFRYLQLRDFQTKRLERDFKPHGHR